MPPQESEPWHHEGLRSVVRYAQRRCVYRPVTNHRVSRVDCVFSEHGSHLETEEAGPTSAESVAGKLEPTLTAPA